MGRVHTYFTEKKIVIFKKLPHGGGTKKNVCKFLLVKNLSQQDVEEFTLTLPKKKIMVFKN